MQAGKVWEAYGRTSSGSMVIFFLFTLLQNVVFQSIISRYSLTTYPFHAMVLPFSYFVFSLAVMLVSIYILWDNVSADTIDEASTVRVCINLQFSLVKQFCTATIPMDTHIFIDIHILFHAAALGY